MTWVFFFTPQKKIAKPPQKWPWAFNRITELIGYQNSADFCEIWPEYSSDIVNQIVSGISKIYSIQPVEIFNAILHGMFFAAQTWHID